MGASCVGSDSRCKGGMNYFLNKNLSPATNVKEFFPPTPRKEPNGAKTDKIFIFPQFPSHSFAPPLPMQRDKVRYVCVDSPK